MAVFHALHASSNWLISCLSSVTLNLHAAACASFSRSEWEGIYVLYTYAAKRQTAKNIQLLLSKPEAGSEGKLLRHITFFKC